MTYYYSYDDWKLSNPDDDGHYHEQEPERIRETIYFKYINGKSWSYGMITEDGYEIRVHHYMSIPTIETDEIEPTAQELDDELHRIRIHYREFSYIDNEEFMQKYVVAQSALTKIIAHEMGD
jgi:hypothetical protein